MLNGGGSNNVIVFLVHARLHCAKPALSWIAPGAQRSSGIQQMPSTQALTESEIQTFHRDGFVQRLRLDRAKPRSALGAGLTRTTYRLSAQKDLLGVCPTQLHINHFDDAYCALDRHDAGINLWGHHEEPTPSTGSSLSPDAPNQATAENPLRACLATRSRRCSVRIWSGHSRATSSCG